MNAVSRMLKAVHASEDTQAALEKAKAVTRKLKEKKLKSAAQKVEQSIMETLRYYDFPGKHRRRIRINNLLERIMKKIRRRTRVIGAILRHIAGTKWEYAWELLTEMKINRKYAA